MKILVVEDDLLVADALKTMLAERNYAVEIVHDGRSGLEFIEAFDYDLLLLDAVVPKLDGVSLCRYVRSRGYLMPILLLTSKDSKHDRAIGLDAGADDYIVKPFDPEELSARIRALLRRGKDRAQPVLKWEDLTLDPRNYEVTYQHQLLNLTPKEYALLELFLRHNRRLFSCGSILEHLWTFEDAPSEEAVRTHIKGLRQKLKAAGAPADLVETVYGIGYRLKSSESLTEISVDRLPERHSSEREITAGAGANAKENHNVATIPTQESNGLPSILSRSMSEEASISCAAATAIAPTLPPHKSSVTVAELPQFLTEIWHRHYPQMLDRLATIERVIAACNNGSMSEEIRKEGWHSAHTIAGAIGTFGLTRGSQLAKQIELLLDGKVELTADRLAQLQTELAQLRQEIDSQVPSLQPEPELPTPPDREWLLLISTATDFAAEIVAAAAGKYEIEIAAELEPDRLARSPHSILLDFDAFPHFVDGLAALSALHRDYPQIPVVVLNQIHPATVPESGTEWLSQRIEIARTGARLSISKSMPIPQMLLAIERVLQQVRARSPKVTIVDDDLALLEGVSALLSVRGMSVTTLADPTRFWEILEDSQPDLLILDLDMPTHDGIELCRAVRTDPQWATLPILVLTAHADPLASDRVFAAGADDFVTKPVVDSTLVTRIVNRLDRIGSQRLHRPPV